ncbi:MAG: DALR anticodon-binding domain-containing protein, partial [Candidatus Moraniibacteriota bacterium]
QDLVHLTYDFVKLPEGMMSSRSGNIITYEELKNKVIDYSRQETGKRHPDWSLDKIEQTAKTIALGAIKFEMLKVEANNTITFDIEQALNFEGFTAAYIQYTFARISSILEKSGESKIQYKQVDPSLLQEEKEKQLLIKMAKYPEVVHKAGDTYGPDEIAKFLFDLAKSFNDYYHNIPILQSDPSLKKARLIFVSSIARIIENGLDLLGVRTMTKM